MIDFSKLPAMFMVDPNTGLLVRKPSKEAPFIAHIVEHNDQTTYSTRIFEYDGITFARLPRIPHTGKTLALVVMIANDKIVDVFHCRGQRWIEMQDEMEYKGGYRRRDIYFEFDRQYLYDFLAAQRQETSTPKETIT